MPASQLINSGKLRTYVPGFSVDWANPGGGPGTLGQTPQAPLGIYDCRPWEGRPKGNASNKDWLRNTTAAPGGELVIRVVHHAAGSIHVQPGETAYQINAATSLMIGAWDELNGEDFGDQDARPISAPQDSVATKQVRMGPNIAPLLQGTGVAEIDLLAWAGGARFVAVWAWTYWVNVAAIPADLLIWEIRDRATPAEDPPGAWASPAAVRMPGLVQTVTAPLIAIPDGPFAATLPNSVFRWSNFPGWNVGVGFANGGPVAAMVEVHGRIGPQAADVFALTVPVGGGATGMGQAGGGGPQQILRPWSHFGFFATNDGPASGFLGGPLLVSISGSGPSPRV